MKSNFIKVLLVVIVFLGAFSLIAKGVPSVPSLPPAEEKFDLAKIKTKQDLAMIGQKIFFGKGKCALCHSIEKSATSRCPPLKGVGKKLKREFLYTTMTQPEDFIYMDYTASPPEGFAAQMPAINKPPIGLNENEMLAVIAFLQTLGGKITVDPSELMLPVKATDLAGDIQMGKRAFLQRGCLSCHTVSGEASPTGRSDLVVALQEKNAEAIRNTILRPQRGEAHQNHDQVLTFKEMRDLVAYLLSLREIRAVPEGGQVALPVLGRGKNG